MDGELYRPVKHRIKNGGRKTLSFVLRLSFIAAWLLVGLSLGCLPGEPAPPGWTLVFAGDVMLGRGVAQALEGNWEAAFIQVQPWLAKANLACANLESPLTSGPQIRAGYDLRAPPASIAALGAAGFDVLSLANNHALDAGQAGLAETITTLNAAGIAGVADQTAGRLASHQPPYPTIRYHLFALDDTVAPLDIETTRQRVAAAKRQTDLVVVSIHWGGEYQAAPSPRQESIAQALAHAGAGLVVGHGPHVLQPVEWIEKTLVAYSLGNLLFDQPYPADCRWGAILRVTCCTYDGHIGAFELLPTVTEQGRVRAAQAEAAAILARLRPGHRTDW